MMCLDSLFLEVIYQEQENIALVPATGNTVAVNNINGGVAGIFADGTPCDLGQSASYTDNAGGVVTTEYNGITHAITNNRLPYAWYDLPHEDCNC